MKNTLKTIAALSLTAALAGCSSGGMGSYGYNPYSQTSNPYMQPNIYSHYNKTMADFAKTDAANRQWFENRANTPLSSGSGGLTGFSGQSSGCGGGGASCVNMNEYNN